MRELIPSIEEQLTRFLVSSPLVLFTCAPVSSWHPIFVSANLLTRWGYSPEVFLQDGFWQACVDAENHQSFLDGLETAFQGNTQIREYRMRHADGTWHWVRDRLVPRMENGVLKAIDGELEDQSEQHRAQELAQIAEENFEKIFQIAPVGIAISGLHNGIFLDVNSQFEELFGWGRPELLDHPSSEFGIWETLDARAS